MVGNQSFNNFIRVLILEQIQLLTVLMRTSFARRGG